MSRIVFRAAEALATALALQAALTGKVKALQQPPDRLADYPALAVLPQRFLATWWTEEDVPDANGDPIFLGTGGSQAVMEIGCLSGSVQLWIGAVYPIEREDLEDAVYTAFGQESLAPGRLLVTLTNVVVGGLATGADWPVAFLHEDSEWREELAFSEQRLSFLDVQVDLPIFILRENAWRVDQYVLAITRDLATPVTAPADLDDLSDLVDVAIDETGALSSFP